MLRILLVCIWRHIESVPKYEPKFFILDTFHLDTTCTWAKIHGYFLKSKGVCEQKGLGNIGTGKMMKLSVRYTIKFPITSMCVHYNTCSSVIKLFTQNYSYSNIPKFGTCFVEYSVCQSWGEKFDTKLLWHIILKNFLSGVILSGLCCIVK
jgi:hypothetical protein